MKKKITLYLKNRTTEALLMANLQRKCFFDPAEPYFWTGRPIGTKIPLYYLTYENPYQRSCWGTIPVRIESNLIKCFLSFSQFN